MRRLFLLAVLGMAQLAIAQIQLKGLVKNTEGTPLEMANIIAVNSETKNIDSYGFSDAFGNYKLNLKTNSNYTIKVSYVGMKTAELVLSTKNKSSIKNIVLEFDNSLDEVEIIAKMPVTIKGDTIVYNADSFKNGTEKKLGDVLEKLPGVAVSDDGEIKVQGKTVKKVMVEGKDFFDGDSKLATKNIPANAVDKIEVLKNHSEVRQMSSVTDNEDNMVINIKLKEGKKNFWFGEVLAGIGMVPKNKRYLAHPKLFYYSPKGSINIIGDGNNIGKLPFTIQDYFKFTGGFPKSGSKNTSFGSSSDLGFLALPNNKAKEIETTFGAVNFSYTATKKWDISGFGIYSGNKTTIEDNTVRDYIDVAAETVQRKIIDIETTQRTTLQKSNLGLLKLSSIYKPDSNHQLNYDVFGKLSKQQQEQQFLSVRRYRNAEPEQVPIQEITRQSPFSIRQNVNYYYTAHDKHIFAFEAQHLWQNENPFYNAQLSQLSFANTLGLNINPDYDVEQEKYVKTNTFHAMLNYYYVINRKSNLNLTVGGTLRNQKFNSSIFEVLEGRRKQLSNPITKNTVNFKLHDYFTGLHYKFISGIFTFNQGFTLHQYSTKNVQSGAITNQNFTKLLPDASVKVHLKKSETIGLAYNQQVDFTDVQKLAEGYVFNNYNSLYAGNRFLENSLLHHINFNYSSYSMFNYTSLYASINYKKHINSIAATTEFNGIEQTQKVIQSNFPEEIISINTSFDKSYRKFKVDIKGNVSYSKLNSFIFSEGSYQRLKSNAFVQNYSTRLSSKFRNAPNFDVGYKVNINRYNQGRMVNTFITHSPFVSIDTFITDELVFSSEFTYNNYRNGRKAINKYSFWDAELGYQKKNSKWRYAIEVTNLLDTKSLNQNRSSINFNSTSSYRIQPRFIMLSAKYEL